MTIDPAVLVKIAGNKRSKSSPDELVCRYALRNKFTPHEMIDFNFDSLLDYADPIIAIFVARGFDRARAEIASRRATQTVARAVRGLRMGGREKVALKLRLLIELQTKQFAIAVDGAVDDIDRITAQDLGTGALDAINMLLRDNFPTNTWISYGFTPRVGTECAKLPTWQVYETVLHLVMEKCVAQASEEPFLKLVSDVAIALELREDIYV